MQLCSGRVPSCQSQSTRQVSRSQASWEATRHFKQKLQNSCIIFFSRSLCIVRNWDTLNICTTKSAQEPHEQLSLLEDYKPSQAWSSEHLPPALSTLPSSSSCRHFTTKTRVMSEHRRSLFARWTLNWPLLTCVILLNLRVALCPAHTVWQKRTLGYLRDSSGGHAPEEAPVALGSHPLRKWDWFSLHAVPCC